jgi:hypothetical protein
MIVKKGFIPPNLDLETPKPSLKLDERKIKVRMICHVKEESS